MLEYYRDKAVSIWHGDALTCLVNLPSESVNCCVTSPPYWGLRDYGVDGQLGLEKTPEEYVAKMVAVFREVRRVLRDDGTLWLNLGDSYYRDPKRGNQENGGHAGLHTGRTAARAMQSRVEGLREKNLIGIPWRVAFALQADGWYLRQDIIWNKPNPMPESVTDRCTKSHEYVFMLSKSPRYYYDQEAIKEPSVEQNWQSRLTRESDKSSPTEKINGIRVRKGHGFAGRQGGSERVGPQSGGPGSPEWQPDPSGRNRRSVWTVTTKPYAEAHFATFPPDLIQPMILAGCPLGGTVLDPFMGSGTTAYVAKEAGRNAIGIELNPAYIKLAAKRLAQEVLAL